MFESHPFTITNAPPSLLSGSPRGIVLYAKVCGDWTRRLHAMARDTSLEIGDDYEEREAFIQAETEGKLSLGADHPGRQVTVMIDGPYGGLKMDLAAYEDLLVVAGGSGVTFLLGTVEDALSWRERGRGPSKITVAWVVRDLSTIEALAPTLAHLATVATRLDVDMSYNLYLTNPPFPLPSCPSILPESSTLSPYRPEVVQLVRQALPTGDFGGLGVESDKALESTPGGGLAVVAAGPEGLVMEARNAVASISVTARVAAGGIGFHDEVYAL
jgi:ferric-chelate reductase